MTTRFILPMFATFLLLSLFAPTAIAQVNDIFDMTGTPVQVDTLYYVLPVVQRRGGGLALTHSCPPYVIQEINTTALGIPVKFSRALPTTKNVTFSSDMKIVFGPNNNNCNEPFVWKLRLDEATGIRFLGVGGKAMARGPKEIDNWFRIERFFPRFHYDYKFVYCPIDTLCPTCEPKCGDLGVYVQADGTWRLGVGAPPLRIKFKRA